MKRFTTITLVLGIVLIANAWKTTSLVADDVLET